MVLIVDDTPRGSIIRFTPLLVRGTSALDSRGEFALLGNTVAYEDVIPIAYFNPGSVDEVIDLLLSLPIPGHDRVNVFMSWAKEVDYNFTVGDLDILRSG